jgi:hypothetical protein
MGGQRSFFFLSGFIEFWGQHMFHDLVVFVNANLAAQWWPLDFVKSIRDMFIFKLVPSTYKVCLLGFRYMHLSWAQRRQMAIFLFCIFSCFYQCLTISVPQYKFFFLFTSVFLFFFLANGLAQQCLITCYKPLSSILGKLSVLPLTIKGCHKFAYTAQIHPIKI